MTNSPDLPCTICVLMPNWVGDACLATPCLRALRVAYPGARIVGVMRPVIRDLLHGAWGDQSAWFDDCLLFSKQASRQTHTRLGLARALRQTKIDVSVLLTNSLWSAGVMRLAGIKRVVGYNRDGRGWLLTDRLPVPRVGRQLKPISQLDYYLEIAKWLGCNSVDRRMQLATSPTDRRLADELWTLAGFSSRRSTVVINNGAATAPTRVWPIERIKQLAQAIAGSSDSQVLLHCGPSEREATNRWASEINLPNVVSMGIFNELPIGLSKAVLERAAVVVSTDSGPRHMAVAMDRKVITLYGPTDPAWTITYNVPEITVHENLPCRACYKTRCPLEHHRCMEDIGVTRVLAAVNQARQHLQAA